MKLCYGLLISSKYEQVCRLIETLNVNDNQVVVLVDKKSEKIYQDLRKKFANQPKVFFIEERFDVGWGDISTSLAAISLMKNCLKFDFDYFTMMSESCLPLYPDKEIKSFLERNKGKEFIDCRIDWSKRSRLHLNHSKPYTAWQRKHRNLLACIDVPHDILLGWLLGKNKQFKSFKVPTTLLWWTSSYELTKYMVETIEKDNLIEKYKNTLIADEHIFAEVVINSPFYDKLFVKNVRGAALLYCDWKTLKSPRILRLKDYKRMYKPKYPCLYARKFDLIKEPEVIEKVYENRNNPDFKCPF